MDYEKVSAVEAAKVLGVTRATVYNRLGSNGDAEPLTLDWLRRQLDGEQEKVDEARRRLARLEFIISPAPAGE